MSRAWAALVWGTLLVLPLNAQESGDSAPDALVSLENLRDALIGTPAPPEGRAENYSLWRDLSSPFFLPASRARSTERGASWREESQENGLPVMLELDLPDASSYPRTLQALIRRTGLRPSPELSLDAKKAKAVIYGKIPAARYKDLIGFPGLTRLEVGGPSKPCENPENPCARLLLGIRISVGSSPRGAWELPGERLAVSSGFTLEKVVGFQRIPLTNHMALLVLGRVPARNIGRLLADPDVVKVAPAPEKPRVWIASVGPNPETPLRFWEFLLSRYPARTLAILLLLMALAGFPAVPSKRRRSGR